MLLFCRPAGREEDLERAVCLCGQEKRKREKKSGFFRWRRYGNRRWNALKSSLNRRDTDATILIIARQEVGKAFTGKERIHNIGRRSKGDGEINCDAIPDNVLGRAFRYAAGAFTGDQRQRKEGLIESADGGTLLLDEMKRTAASLGSSHLKVIFQLNGIAASVPWCRSKCGISQR